MNLWARTVQLWTAAILAGGLLLSVPLVPLALRSTAFVTAYLWLTALMAVFWVGGVIFHGLKHRGWERLAHFIGSAAVLAVWFMAFAFVSFAVSGL